MKRLIVYYSLSGNTGAAVQAIAEQLGCDTARVDTVKPMPKSFAAQILVGGGQVAMHIAPGIRPLDKDPSAYDEILIGTPVWNSKCVPAIRTFLKDAAVCRKVTGLIITSGGGKAEKCIAALKAQAPNVRCTLSLLDPKHPDSARNGEKTAEFIRAMQES